MALILWQLLGKLDSPRQQKDEIAQKPSVKTSWLKRIWQGFVKGFILDRFSEKSSEPKIWQKRNRFGETFFQVYDPATDRYIYLNSEKEVRVWLDDRFSYRTGDR